MNSAFYISVDPVIFHVGPFSIGWYGIMVALAVVAVVSWVTWENKKGRHFSPDTIMTASIIGIISGIVFAKVLHVIDQFPYYFQNPGRILSGEGLTIWGAVLGATIGVWLYSRFNREFRFTLFGDMIAPGIILSQAVGRVGCTFNGCCYGIQTDSPIAIIYSNPNSYAPIGIPVLPTQVIEIFYDLIIFGILLLLRKKLKPEGAVFIIYFAFYAAWRFGIDFVRDGTPFFKNIHFLANVPFLSDLHEAQVIGLLIMLITIPLIICKVRWKKAEDMNEITSQNEEFKND
jgi:phosphatidylglycerol---prolipoprotein diacylglyceryl transferase